MGFDKKGMGVREMQTTHIEDNFKKLAANILFNKTDIVKDNIIKMLDLRESQFETIIRKDAGKFTTVLVKGGENSIITERFFYEERYLFTLDTIFSNTTVRDEGDIPSTIIHYVMIKEEPVPVLKQLALPKPEVKEDE